MYVEDLNKCKKFRDTRLYKAGKRKKNKTLMWFADMYFSNFLYDDNIVNNFSFKMCCSLIFGPSETEL